MNKNPANFVPLTPISFYIEPLIFMATISLSYMRTGHTPGVKPEKDVLELLRALRASELK